MANNKPSAPGYDEVGRVGQFKYAGIFYEEFLRELRGRRGCEIYKEMADNDDVIGAILFALEMLMRQVTWSIDPPGTATVDKNAADFLESCMHDMQQTWSDTISEVLSFLTFGWSYHEIVYKRRMGQSKDPKLNSKYDDGLIGWRKLPIRSQDTLYRWEYGEDTDDLTGMTQMAPPDFMLRTIPIEKAIHFVTKSRKANPEGRSILRNAYRSWYFKRRIQEIEAVGIERDLAGLPVMKPPADTDIWNKNDPTMVEYKNYAKRIVTNIRRDQEEGIVLPAGWELSLLTTGGRRQFDTNAIVERYDSRIAMTVLADFVLLGHQQVGSFALSSDKTELFSVAIGAFLDLICDVFNDQAIPRLIDLNGATFEGITDYPKLTHGDVESPDLTELGTFIKDMTGVGVLTPDENLEDYIRRAANLPERLEQDYPAPVDNEEDDEDDNPDGEIQPSAGNEKDDAAAQAAQTETTKSRFNVAKFRRMGRK